MADRTYYLPAGDKTRLALYAGDGLLDLADEDCTSDSCTTQVHQSSPSVTRVCMTPEQGAWLRDVLISLNLGPAPAGGREG